MILDPAAHGSVHEDERPPRFDRCPECGGALDWAWEGVQGPDGPERWAGHGAECDCGMRYSWRPNQPHLRQKRRHVASERHEDERRSGQLTLEAMG